MTGAQLLFTLLRSVLSQSSSPYSPTFEEFRDAYHIAKHHDLAHFVYYALEKSGCLPSPQSEEQTAFLKKAAKHVLAAQYRYAKQEAEVAHLSQVLSDAQIVHMPMKGAVVCDLYPEPWMRTRCDIDMLVPNTDFERAVELLVCEGYAVDGDRNYHDISLFCDGVHLELHHNIMEHHKDMDALLDQVWKHTVADGLRHRETPSFFRFHHIAHMAHHFMGGGCGIRTVLDLWLLRRAPDHDEAAVRALCESARLLTFYESMSRLADVWFGDGTHDDETLAWEQFILNGGTYGTQEQRQSSFGARYGRWGMACRILFMPYRDIKNVYPSLDGKPYLTPLYQVYHIVRRIGQGQFKNGIERVRAAGSQSARNVAGARDIMRSVGLL